MYYIHTCPEHGEFEINCKMSEASENKPCPICKKESKRVYGISGIQWKTGGAFGKSKD